MPTNTIGPKGQLYADQTNQPLETAFRQDNTSAAYYSSVYYKAHKDQVQPIPRARDTTPLDLADFLPGDLMASIKRAGKICFHAVGDTGAAKVSRSETAATAIGHENAVADALAGEIASQGAAFFFHLGDVIYNFGEAQYYYDQFYEPFRNYDRPIFAIPGNHDGMVFGPGSAAPQVPTLAAFLTNFCAAAPGLSPDAGGLVRSMMTQPGVYFALDAPFVSIIGLYSNVLDNGPGVISSQKGHFPLIDDQLGFLTAQLQRLRTLRQTDPRAVIVAVHHPPLSADAKHGGSLGIQLDIDACCQTAGLWPDLVLSGHAHLYQRFTRKVAQAGNKQTPYLVAGSGGYSATPPMQHLGKAPITIGDHTLEIDPIIAFGYLTLETDGKTLTATFKTADGKSVTARDAVTIDLVRGTITARATKPAGAAGKAKRGKSAAKQPARAAAKSRAKQPAAKRKAAGKRKSTRG